MTAMEHRNVPVAFGEALARNEAAVNAYAMMTREQKQAVLKKAERIRSDRQMQQLMDSLAQTQQI